MTDFRISLNDSRKLSFNESSASTTETSWKTSSSLVVTVWSFLQTNVSDLPMLLMRIMGFDREMNCGRITRLIAHRTDTTHALLKKGSN